MPWTALLVASAAVLAAIIWLPLGVHIWRVRGGCALVIAAGAALFAWMLVRSGWRGTLYPTAMLRAGQRVKLI